MQSTTQATYYILKNPFKTASLETVLSMMGTLPYFYDTTSLIGGYTHHLTPLLTHHEEEDKRKRVRTGMVYAAKPGDEIFDIKPPIDEMQSPRGWLVGRAEMRGYRYRQSGSGEPADEVEEGWYLLPTDEVVAATLRNLQNSLDQIARYIDNDDEYYPLTFPEHPTGNFYIVDSAPNPTSGGSDYRRMRDELDKTLEKVRETVTPGPPVVDHPEYAHDYTYIPQPFHQHALSELLIDLCNIRTEHYGVNSGKHTISIITPDNHEYYYEYLITQSTEPSYWELRPQKHITAPNGWIVMHGTPEANRTFIEKIYSTLFKGPGNCPPVITPEAFAPHVKNMEYISRIVYYPVTPDFYQTPV